MTEETYALLDSEGSVINVIVASAEFVSSLSQIVEDESIESPNLERTAIRVDSLSQPINVGWKRKNNEWVEPPRPSAEEIAAHEAFITAEQARNEARVSDDARLQVLRAKVGPGKPGLTQAERDELMLIQLSRS